MQNEDAKNREKRAPNDVVNSPQGAQSEKQKRKPTSATKGAVRNKWSLNQHWKTASKRTRVKWVFQGVAAVATVGGIIQGLLSYFQTKRNFETENRSSISLIEVDMLNHPEPGEQVDLQFVLANTGKMDARNAFEQVLASVGHDLTLSAPPTPDRIESGMTLPSRQPITVRVSTKPLTEFEADGVNKGKLCVFAAGYISYWDEFGGKQSVFCGIYKSSQPWSPQSPGIAFCPHNNRVLWDGRETGSHITKCE